MVVPPLRGGRVFAVLSTLSLLLGTVHPQEEPANPPCSICPEGLQIGAMNNIVQDPVNGDRISCLELQNRAESGSYDEIQCKLIIQPASAGTCACYSNETSVAPGETTEPPATTQKPVTGRVTIDLVQVGGEMTEDVQKLFESATTEFLQSKVADQPDTTVSSTKFLEQTFTASASRLLRGRKLQAGGGGELKTVVSVEGAQDSPNSETFSKFVADAIKDDPAGYITVLQASGTDYFANVTTVTSGDYFGTSTKAPTKAPTEAPAAPPAGLTVQAKAGIAIGVVVGVILIGAVGYAVYKNCLQEGAEPFWKSGGGPAQPAGGAAGRPASPAGKKFSHKVDVLPGKLGLSIRVGTEGPIINNIKEESPLTGILEAGDVITAIDDVDTRAMSGQAISELMVNTQDVKRTITVLTATGPSRYTRKVVAPSGKLGLLIKVSSAGPAINKIKEESPLVNILREDDFICAIDDVNTKNMSAAEVSELMVSTQDKERTLTIATYEQTAPKVVAPAAAAGAAAAVSAAPAAVAPPPAVKDNRNRREVNAPAGKLGLILKAAPEGPVVHQIKDGSPLVGHLFEGDCIVSIDEVDTTTMSATEISELMVKTQKHQRVITVLSDKEPTALSPPEPATRKDAPPPKEIKEKFTREVIAKAGKLGITIDTTPNGPAVHKIKDESQMNGVLRIGDIILKIDDVETTSMSASAISALMVKTEDKERTLTVLGDEP